MNKKITFLMAAMILLLMLVAHPFAAVGQERGFAVAYTLTPETNSASASSAYDQFYDFTINEVVWSVQGNTGMNPWRIGGKKSTISSTGTGDRPLYSKTKISDNISKIVITHGNSTSNITVNSITLIVSTAQDGGGTVISSLTGSYSNNTTTTFERPAGKDWSDRYYKIVYNVTNTSTTQKYVLFSEAVFYKTTYTVTYNCNGGESGCPSSPVNNVSEGNYTLASAPTRDNYTFTGWSDGTDVYDAGAIYNLTSDQTFVAQWMQNLPASDLALTDAPVALGFDLYNNSDAQIISYTTSSTGEVTVSESDYITAVVDQSEKTITITPTAVTPSAQTITVSQVADATYAAGSATFTVSVTDCTPTITISGNGIVNNVVNLNCDDADTHTATVAYANINNPSPTLGIFSNLDCTQEYDGLDFDADFANGNIEAIEYAFMDENTDPDNARTVYIRVAVNAVYSNVITITQGAYIQSYDVMFDTDGGTFVGNEDFPSYAETKEAGTYALPSATRQNYIFAGWFDGSDLYEAGAEYTVSSDVEFTAQWVQGGTINFGNNGTKINSTSVTGNDSFGKTWTITSVFSGTTSFTQSDTYSQVGASGKAASSITFTTTLSNTDVTVTNMSAKFGGYSGTIGTITLKVGETIVGTGSLDDGNDVVINTEQVTTGKDLTVVVENSSTKAIKCYYISYTFTTSTAPIISAPTTVNLYSDDTDNEFEYGILRPIEGKSLMATTTADWISNINVTGAKVTFETSENTSATENRTGIIKLCYEGAVSKTVTIIQSKIDYATMPFTYDNNGTSNQLVAGLTSNLSDSYSSSPKMKFDAAGKYLVLHFHEAPASLSYNIKGMTFSNGTFNVQISSNGTDYDDLATYTTLDNNNVKTITHLNLPATTRFIKLIYADKGNGNVALGNIKASVQYDVYGSLNMESLTIPSGKICTVHSPAVFTVTNLTNNGTTANLIVENGAQLITNNAVNATVQKTIAARSTENDVNKGWAFVASPIATDVAPTSVSNMTGTDFDLYRFNQSADLEWENWKKTGNHFQFNLVNGQGYLYNNVSTKTLEFAGAIKSSNTPISVAIDSVAGKEFAGWNLVGNPFTFNAYVNRSFYKMNDDGSAILATEQTTGTIAPCTGIMVKATETNQNVVFSKPTQNAPSNGNVSIAVVQANERGASASTVDKAIVSFNEGSELPKFYFGNPNANLYIPQGNKEYAITCTEGQGELPVNFRANADGQYTLTVNPEGVEMNYLHLIDNMTGNDIDLLQTPNYSFNAKTTDYESRFRLVFASNGTSTSSANEETFAFFSNGNLVVNNEGEATLQVIDVMGRVLSSQTISGTAELNLNTTPGVYVLRLVNGNDVKTQKIVVK